MKILAKIWQFLLKNRNFSSGVFFISIGIILPSFLTINNLGIYDNIILSTKIQDTGILILAAFKISFLNSIRALPLYVGAFYVTNSIFSIRKKPLFHFIVVFLILSLCYKSIQMIYGITYDFSYPAIILIVVIFLLEKYEMYNVSIIKKVTVMILVLISVQFLDTVPELSPLGFGRGEISTDIKNASAIIDHYHSLTVFSLIFFIVFLFNAFLVLKILIDQHALLDISNKKRLAELELYQSRLRLLESRSTEEIQNLVHDLKTPLTSIQGLANVIEIKSVDSTVKEYSHNISNSAEIMNGMISEILYENTKNILDVPVLIDYVFSQIKTTNIKNSILMHNHLRQEKILVNKIRFSRALVNIIENAYKSIDKDDGLIEVSFDKECEYIVIKISDNGQGISETELNHIWDIGYSNSGSTGLGLNFVKKVVENHKGIIEIHSRQSVGTTVTIKIKEVL
jgi:signal transduction histidine kinase